MAHLVQHLPGAQARETGGPRGQGSGQVELCPDTVHVVDVEGVGRGEELLQQRIGLEFAEPE
ncbi:hypothetical protein [Streptomyces lydicus]|uniref:hypothetical protein n=1 Tax=Streptomyces lydicus TaxID=47763 RepID=UPI0037B99705